MDANHALTTLLTRLQDVHDGRATTEIYQVTTSLLGRLSNPLNVSLLTSQILNAPAVWQHPNPLQTCYRVIGIFNSAAFNVRTQELDHAHGLSHDQEPRQGRGLGIDVWARAVIRGVENDPSPRWKHLLVFAGILIALERGDRESIPRSLRNALEQAVVTAANLALEANAQDDPAGSGAVVLALNYAFPIISYAARVAINCDLLLPLAVQALVGADGLNGGIFLHILDPDVVRSGQTLSWSPASPSFSGFMLFKSKPMVAGLGPLSKLLAHAVEHAKDPRLVLQVLDNLVAFTKSLFNNWQASKLCELELSELATSLTPETQETTWPDLWQLLKNTMFAVVAVLYAIVSRGLLDHRLMSHALTPSIANKSLHVLRNLYFISSQHGNSAFQVYTFTYLVSIDILTRYPDACIALLQELRSPNPGVIPAHPLLRTLDLFYLNLTEHLPLSLAPEACDAFIVQPATTYLTHSEPLSARMLELFESAHSAVLSVLSCPNNAPLTARLAPFYAETLFESFPSLISSSQFRLAFRTMIQVLSPPFPVSVSHPMLAETLLEMVHHRIITASSAPLPPRPGAQGQPSSPSPDSEQSTLVMALIDTLPFLHIDILENWMVLASERVHRIQAPGMREAAQRRFWEILANGEMDVERAAIGVAWWGTGGRELVLNGGQHGAPAAAQFMMSGAIQDEATGSRL